MTKLYGAFLGSVLFMAACSGTDERPPDREPVTTDSSAQNQPHLLSERAGIVLVLGNSLAAGLGVRSEEAFPALIQERIDSLGWNFKVVNAGVSGDTSSGGLRRLDWLLRDSVDVLVLELGANDGLRGISPEAMHANLAAIIDGARARYPGIEVVLAGMRMPPNLGQTYTRAFEQVYAELAREKEVALIPFLLDRVGGVASLNQNDGIHPTAEGHEIIAETVWQYLEPVLARTRFASTPV